MQDAVKIEAAYAPQEAVKSTMSLSGQKDMGLASSSSSSSEVSSSSSSFLDAFAEAAATMSSLSSPSSDFSSSSPVEDDSEPGEEEDEFDDEDDDEDDDDEELDNESESRRRTLPSSVKTASQNKFAAGQIQGAVSSPSLPLKLAPKVTSLVHKTPGAGDSSEAFKRAIEKRRYTKRGRRRKLDPEITNLLSTFLREKTAAGVLYTQADVITFVKELTKGEVVLSNVDVTRYTQRLGFNRRDKPRPAPSSLPPPVPIGPPIAPRVSPRVPFPSSSAPSGPVSTPSQQKTNQRTTRSSAAATTSSSSPSAPVQSPAATVSQRPSRHSQPPQRSLSSTSQERHPERHHTVGPVSPPSHHVPRPGYYPDVSDPLVYAQQQQQQQQQLKAYQDYQAHQYMQMMYQHMVHQQMQEMERFQQQQQEQMHLAAQRMAEARHSQPVPSFPNRHYPAPEAPVHYPEHRGPFAEPRANERVETTAPVAERPLWKPQKKASHRLPSHLPSTSSLPMAPVSVKRASNSQPPLPSVRHLLDALAPHVSYC